MNFSLFNNVQTWQSVWDSWKPGKSTSFARSFYGLNKELVWLRVWYESWNSGKETDIWSRLGGYSEGGGVVRRAERICVIIHKSDPSWPLTRNFNIWQPRPGPLPPLGSQADTGGEKNEYNMNYWTRIKWILSMVNDSASGETNAGWKLWRWIREEGPWLPTTKLFRHLWGKACSPRVINWFMFSLLWRITWHGLAASYLWREARSIVSCAETSNIWGPRLPSVRLITVNSNLISVLAPSSTGFKRNPPGSRPDRIQHRDHHGSPVSGVSGLQLPTLFTRRVGSGALMINHWDWN